MIFFDSFKRYLKLKLLLNSIKCIIWDYDGTLYKSKSLGPKLKKNFFLIAKKYHKNLSLKNFNDKSKLLGSWSSATSFFSSIPEQLVCDLVDQKINKLEYIHPDLDLLRFIESTKHKFIHVILTNSNSDEVLQSLSKIGFKKDTFQKIFSRDNTKLLKPNKKIYRLIERDIRVQKDQYLQIGDSIDCDIKPAQEYGFKALPVWEFKNLIK